jgi:aspartate aminotransferase-like enzyme
VAVIVPVAVTVSVTVAVAGPAGDEAGRGESAGLTGCVGTVAEGLAGTLAPWEGLPGCKPARGWVTAWQEISRREKTTSSIIKRRMGGIIAACIEGNCFTKLFLREAQRGSAGKIELNTGGLNAEDESISRRESMTHLFVPGPVDVDPEVLAAQTQPMLAHRSKEFETLFQRASEKARHLFFTQSRVFITASSGSGLQEAAVRNLAKESVLACVNGAFARRWYDVAAANGKEVDLLEFEWDRPVDPQQVAGALRRKQSEALLVVHNETSTGLQNPVQEIAAAARAASPDTLICVDAVSSLGGTKIEMDAWGLDLLLTSSQKCLALPPGLGLAAVSDRALKYAASVPNRGWYFDFLLLEKHRLKDSTPATPALSLIYALDLQLDRILAEGLEQRFARHSAMASRVQEWALGCGLDLFAPEGYRSQTVTTIDNTRGLNVGGINKFLMEREMRIANGYGPLKGKTFRIAHMGETRMEDIDVLLKAMEDYLATVR